MLVKLCTRLATIKLEQEAKSYLSASFPQAPVQPPQVENLGKPSTLSSLSSAFDSFQSRTTSRQQGHKRLRLILWKIRGWGNCLFWVGSVALCSQHTRSCSVSQTFASLIREACARPAKDTHVPTDREQLSLTQQPFQSAPVEVWAETLIAAALCLWGELPSLHHRPVGVAGKGRLKDVQILSASIQRCRAV